MTLSIDKDRLSLKIGKWEKITASKPCTWSSDNSNVFVDGNGWVLAVEDALRVDTPSGEAKITAKSGAEEEICRVTIVTWPANRINLVWEDVIDPGYEALFKKGDVIYGGLIGGTTIIQTEDFVTITDTGFNLPAAPQSTPILDTPLGYFYRSGDKIYRSADLETWTLSYETALEGSFPQQMFDYYYDGSTLYVYAGEYTAGGSNRHKVYRGTITSGGENWEAIYDFYSQDEITADPVGNWPGARHVHLVATDKTNGNLYVSTGDADIETHIILSEDNGNTFRHLGYNAGKFRPLGLWFTGNYVYWNMDAREPQAIWRLRKTNLAAQALDNDLTERVIWLNDGLHYFHCWAKDDLGDDVVILGAAAGYRARDHLARTYMIKEVSDDRVEVDELYSVPYKDAGWGGDPDWTYFAGTRLDPKIQDKNGYIYLRGRDIAPIANNLLVKMSINRPSKPSRKAWRSNIQFKS